MSAGARAMGHYLSFGMTFVMMLGLSIYIYEHRRKMSVANWWSKWGPFILMVVASLLVCADPFRHVLQDLDFWPSPASSEYRQTCHDENFRCMTPLGLFMTLGMTYVGFTLLMVAALWNANVMSKCQAIKDQWNSLRGNK